jgi:hypothetical protein
MFGTGYPLYGRFVASSRAARQNAGGFAIIMEEPAYNSVSNHVFEDMILFAEGTEFLGGEVGASFRCAEIPCIANFKNNGPVEVLIRKRVEEHVVDDAEDDGGGANAESQGEDGDEGDRLEARKLVSGLRSAVQRIERKGELPTISDAERVGQPPVLKLGIAGVADEQP